MKSAFFILLLLFSTSELFSGIATIATPNGKVKSINIIDNLGYQYSDWEYTSSIIIGEVKSDSTMLSLSDNVSMELSVGSDKLKVNAYGQTITHNMGMPALHDNNRVIVPFHDYLKSLDSLGFCKLLSIKNNSVVIEGVSYIDRIPFISQYNHKFNMAYYKMVYSDVSRKYKKKKSYYKPTPKVDNSIDLLKDALDNEEKPKEVTDPKKDTYYDIPRELDRDEVLKKKKED